MYKAVDPIDPCHNELVIHKKCLDRKLPEDGEIFFCHNDLKSVLASCEDCAFCYPYCSGSSAKLVNLLLSVLSNVRWCNHTQYIKPQYQHSTRNGNLSSSRLKK
jgi:hypothetical protein